MVAHLEQFWLHLVHTLVAIQRKNNKIEKINHGKELIELSSPLQIGVVTTIPHLDHSPTIKEKNCHGKMLTQFWSLTLVILVTTSQHWKDYYKYILAIYSIYNSDIYTHLNAPKR